MSFFTDPSQQMTLDDPTYHLTAREQKALEFTINHIVFKGSNLEWATRTRSTKKT